MLKSTALFVTVAIVACLHRAAASNYDAYLQRLSAQNRQLHQLNADRLAGMQDALAAYYPAGDAIDADQAADAYDSVGADEHWDNVLRQAQRASRGGGEDDDGRYVQAVSESGGGEGESAESAAASAEARDSAEHVWQNHLWGPQRISGGSGKQQPARTEVKTDEGLPSYCSPPNPCPLGVDPATHTSPCETGIEEDKYFQKMYNQRQMESGRCKCDKEHMKDCPTNNRAESEDDRAERRMVGNNMYLSGEKRIHEAKKFMRREQRKWHDVSEEDENPYLHGDPVNTVEKKNGRPRLYT